ncbi:MAG: DUF6460 domain-containing protein [Parvularculaceae bacterium]
MADNDLKSRLFHGGAARTAFKLAFACIIVGAVFSFMGLSPREFWSGVFHNVSHLIGSLGENVAEIVMTILTYLAIGAMVVLPIWLVSRLLSSRK